MKLRLAFTGIIAAFCSGCGTYMTHTDDVHWPPHPYSGVTFDCVGFYRSVTNWDQPYSGLFVFAIFDVPFSFVGDTVCLPYDIYEYSEYGN
jgi:uncharacterized protein YceK